MEKKVRHPISNFFILRGLQIGLIKKVVFSAMISTLVGLGSLIVVYYIKYDNTAFYPVSFTSNAQIGDRESIVSIILPSLVISAIINMLIALAIGLYASRKYAVPIFKLEKWSDLLIEGKLSAKLHFREREELKVLSDRCNLLSEVYRNKFETIQNAVNNLAKNDTLSGNTSLKAITETLESLSFSGSMIDVKTGIHTLKDLGQTHEKR